MDSPPSPPASGRLAAAGVGAAVVFALAGSAVAPSFDRAGTAVFADDGASNRQIARALGVSLKTVQNHVSRILDKLQAGDRTQAALRARGISPHH